MSNISFDGLITGLDTTAMIQRLMAVERQPLVRLQERQKAFDARVTAWGDISTSLSSVRTALSNILSPAKFDLFSATSSDKSILTATASPTASPGALTFRVTALAAAHQVMSQAFTSSSQLVGAGTFTVGEGLSQLGFSGAVASGALTEGTHSLKVVSTSAPATSATVTGTALTTPVTIAANTKQLDLEVNGAARSVQIATGTYNTLADLATAVQTALGNDVTVSVNGSSLQLTTVATGASSSLRITGGNALPRVGFSVMGSPATGADAGGAIVELDGVQTLIGTPGVGQQVTVDGVAGSVTLTVGGPITVGDASVHAVHTDGTTTLAQLATELDGTGLGATAVDTGSGQFHLVLTAPETGTNHSLTVHTGALAAFTAPFTDLRPAADAQVAMGALTITRHSNTITDLVPGVTLNLVKADPATDVTVTVGRDVDGIVAKVKSFVDALNSTLSLLKKHNAAGDVEKEIKPGVLAGDSGVRRLRDQLVNGMWYQGTGDHATLSSVGITLGRDGLYALDETDLRDALAADFDGVVDLLAQDTVAGTQGAFGTVLGVVDAARAVDGLIDSATRSAQQSSDDIVDRIERAEVRLDSVEARYRRQFAALEALMGQLQSQSSWLAGQIGQLGQ